MCLYTNEQQSHPQPQSVPELMGTSSGTIEAAGRATLSPSVSCVLN